MVSGLTPDGRNKWALKQDQTVGLYLPVKTLGMLCQGAWCSFIPQQYKTLVLLAE